MKLILTSAFPADLDFRMPGAVSWADILSRAKGICWEQVCARWVVPKQVKITGLPAASPVCWFSSCSTH